MYQSKNCTFKKLLIISSLTIICLTLSTFAPVRPTVGMDENFTYYGVVPVKICRYILNDGNNRTSGWILGFDNMTLTTGSPGLDGRLVATKSLLAVVASEDGTNFEVYNLVTSQLIASGTIGSMEKRLILMDNGTAFKVVSDKMVSVLLLNYQQLPSEDVTEGPTPATYYTSTDGLYVGKEFVFMASEYQSGTFFTILAIEKSTVTVTDEDGGQNTYSVETNMYKNIVLTPFKVYKIESTGNIMVQSTAMRAGDSIPCFTVPSAEGGFVGKFFLTESVKSWDANRDLGYRIMASEDANVKVYDLETKQVINEFSVTGGNGIGFRPIANAICVESDKPISMSYIHNSSIEQARSITGGYGGEFYGYGIGVTFITIRSNEDTVFHMPVDANVEAYFFASEATQLTIDSITQTIQANSGFMYTTLGTHTVSADHNVILQVNFWPLEPEYQGDWYTGAAIPCVETANTNPTVTITLIGEGFPMMYLIVGVGVAAVAVIVGIFFLRRRSARPSQ